MSATTPDLISAAAAGDRFPAAEFQYRPLHSAAVASVVLALLAATIFLAGRDSLQASLMLSPLPLAGLAVGLRSLRTIKESEGQLGGARIALAGTLGSAFCLFGGLGFAGYVYATELPDGYVRTSFVELRPDEVEARGGQAIPQEVLALDGKHVFLKGYIRPDSTPVRRNVRQFLLVRDSNNCCFGDISTVKYYDQVGVQVDKSLRMDYRSGLIRIGGILHVAPRNAQAGAQDLVYTLEADYAQ